jgi:hypothetical protein
MAERESRVGISNREAPEDEARERREHPRQVEGEAAESEQDEPQILDGQSSTKSGTKAAAQKNATTRHTENTAPASAKVQGAFGKESE